MTTKTNDSAQAPTAEPNGLNLAGAIIDSLNDALLKASRVAALHPELGRFEIGNIDEAVGYIERALDVMEHVEGNLKTAQP